MAEGVPLTIPPKLAERPVLACDGTDYTWADVVAASTVNAAFAPDVGRERR